jgi:glycosyltransferase involved in cell wall biosynthesis
MIIAIDCRHIDSSGVGVYSRETLPFLLQSKNSFFLIGNAEKLAAFTTGYTNAEILECGIRPFSLRELCAFPSRILKKINNSDCFYSPFFNIPGGITVPVYTTIHDIIFPDMPELVSKTGLAARMWFYRRAFNRSKKIFTVSEFSKSRIQHYSNGKVPLALAYDAVQRWIINGCSSPPEKQETIVFIGNIKKHKGLDCLLEAFLRARNEGLPHRLLIIGCGDNFRSADDNVMRKIESIGNKAVTFTGFVSNERLAQYISGAALLVQPSLYEGFGLPPLEAMALGTRALVSDIPVFREIYGSFPVVFFKAGDSESLKNKLMEILYNKKMEPFMLQEELLQKYTFEKTALAILQELK